MRNFLPLGILLIMINMTMAQEKELVINAASLIYEKDGSKVEAKGSVEALYKTSKITGEHMVYYSISREAFLDTGFALSYNSLGITGKTLNYNLNQETGRATGVSLQYDKANISGGEVSLSHDLVKLRNASFDTCGLAPPHYHISAAEIDLYQKQAWLVAYWGIFWLGPLPSLPIPVYVYDFKAEQKGRKNVMPYPEAGTNADDGFWIRETMSWHLNPAVNGSYNMSYAARRGAGGGFDLQYQIDNEQECDAALALNASEPLSGAVEYKKEFGREVRERRELIMLPIETYRQFLFDLKLSRRERINYERVSKTPDVSLILRRTNLLDGWIEASAGAGFLAEESSSRSLGRGNLNATFSYPIMDGFNAKANLDASLYGDSSHWLKLRGTVDYSRRVNGGLVYDISYSHFFLNRGQSPFNFEKYRFSASDQIGLSLYSFGPAGRYIFSCSYLLPDLFPQEIDYTAGMTLHCFNVDLTYRAMRGEFVLGFSLN